VQARIESLDLVIERLKIPISARTIPARLSESAKRCRRLRDRVPRRSRRADSRGRPSSAHEKAIRGEAGQHGEHAVPVQQVV